MNPLGIIAGGGELPRAVAESVLDGGGHVFIVALRGMCGDWAEKYDHAWVSLGEPGRALKALSNAGAADVLLVGRVERPKFSELKLDAKGVMIIPKVVAAARQGDDALLRLLVGLFEAEGFRAVSVAEAAPGLVAGEGPVGRLKPNDDQSADIAQAFAIVRALGAVDVGQAAVVCDGLALAVEAAEGTDRMIARVSELRENLRGTPEKTRRAGQSAQAHPGREDRHAGDRRGNGAPRRRGGPRRHRFASRPIPDRGQARGGRRGGPVGPVRNGR